ncbi:ArsR family transcriptional regulator [Opitutaceae bacterium EW11]|nr:ArsR family transcriptional regulator [Opitutaceae bacterium EW11]
MDLVAIYECLCDRTRLRILHLLLGGPLCVCHFQEILGEPQVKISKHLGYLKRNGLVAAERCGQWMIYRLPETRPAPLEANLACLQDCVREETVFRSDAARLRKIRAKFGPDVPVCVRELGGVCDGAAQTRGTRRRKATAAGRGRPGRSFASENLR